MKLTMLGTGNAGVTQCYNTCFVLENGNEKLLVDGGGGNGLLKNLRLAGIKPQEIRQIFLSHKHIDHLLGIVWMMRLITQGMSRHTYEGEATIYGHDEVIDTLDTLSTLLLNEKETAYVHKRLHLQKVKDGETLNLISCPATFFDIGSTKAKQYGFTMQLPNGGGRLCFAGDEPLDESCYPYAKDAAWLLHEAFCLYEERDIFKPYQKSHTTVKEACEIAETLGVKNLILYHTEDKNIANRKALYTAEGRQYYSGNLLVPDDLDQISL